MENIAVTLYILLLFCCTGGDSKLPKSQDLGKCRNKFVTFTSSYEPFDYTTPDNDSIESHEANDVYHLELTNTGPVVLDSIIDFRASMYDEHGHVADPKLFLYIWQNDATFRDLRTENGFTANLTNQVFRTYSVDPRIYTMQVCVYDRETVSPGIIKHTRVAQGKTKFVLTESLNGYSHVQQNLKYQLNKTVFATNKRVHFSVNLTDRFSEKTESQYYWYEDMTLMKHSSVPKYNFEVSEPRSVRLSVTTTLVGVQAKSQLEGSVTNNTERNVHFSWFDFTEKNGEWKSKIVFIDEITAINITENNASQVGENFTFNVTYQGSDAISLCWEVWKNDLNHTEINGTNCTDVSNSNETTFSINVRFPVVGIYFINVSVMNDVSIAHRRTGDIHVTNPSPDPIPGHSKSGSRYTIPAIFTSVGVVIVIIGIVYIIRIRKKNTIEVADFDFHPRLHEERSHPLIVWSKGLFSAVFRQDKYSTAHKHPNFRPSTAKSYGTLIDSNQML